MNKMLSKLLKPKAIYAKWLIVIMLITFFSLGFMDYIKPLETLLSSENFSFQIGELKFTLFLLLKAIFTIVILFWISGIVSEFGEQRIKKLKGVSSSNKSLATKAFQTVIYFLAFLIALDLLGIDLTTLAVFSGAVGIGVGFGLQKITSNFISGIILLFEKSVEDGDLVELADGTYGFIRQTSARYTLIETFEGKEILIPNEDFITTRVTNWTYTNNKGRVEISIGVSYNSDIELARKLILEAAQEHERCIDDPEPVCYLRNFGDSSVDFLLFFWVANVTEGRYGPQSEVMFSIWNKFKENRIEIPFPQRDIHIKSEKILQEVNNG